MLDKSYPEMLHDIFVHFNYGEKNKVTPFERGIVSLLDKIIMEEKKKLTNKNEYYSKNNNIKVGCESCSRYVTMIGCSLKHPDKCTDNNNNYSKYRKAHLLACDRCKTYSVITKIDMILYKDQINPRPLIRFICLNCSDYPMINGGIFRGYELRGVEFSEKYLMTYRQREELKILKQLEDHKIENQDQEQKQLEDHKIENQDQEQKQLEDHKIENQDQEQKQLEDHKIENQDQEQLVELEIIAH